jgi:hypothetical protein
MTAWKPTLFLIAAACALACGPAMAQDHAAGSAPDPSAKLIAKVLDCAIRDKNGQWLADQPSLYRDGILRFSYLHEPPSEPHGANRKPGDPKLGWPDEDLLYVAFWNKSSGAQKTGAILVITVPKLGDRQLLLSTSAEVVMRNGELYYADRTGANWSWTNQAIWYRVQRLESAAVHTFAVRDIPDTSTDCESGDD